MRKGLQNNANNENMNYKIIAVDDEQGIEVLILKDTTIMHI